MVLLSLTVFSIIYVAKYHSFKQGADTTTNISVEKENHSHKKTVQIDLNNINNPREIKIMSSDLIQVQTVTKTASK